MQQHEPIKKIVFDAYGTLFDLGGIAAECDRVYPGSGERLAVSWRQKQLEYTWLSTLMDRYLDFESVTRKALLSTLGRLGLPVDRAEAARLSDAFLRLKPFPEVTDTLKTLTSSVSLVVLSNGTGRMLHELFQGPLLPISLFDRIISVDLVRRYKPHPAVYRLVTEPSPAGVLFVSSNPWDVAGAAVAGLKAAWINRDSGAGQRGVFDGLGGPPDHTLASIAELVAVL